MLISLLFMCGKDNGIAIIDPPFIINLIDKHPSWSQDGKTIVYIHQEPYPNDSSGIYTIDTNGTNKRLLLEGFYESPDWSPDGQWIVFSNSAQIYKIKFNQDSLTQLTSNGNNFFPAWSDDGEWIAYDSNFDSPNGSGFYYIWKMKKDGSNKIRIGLDTIHGSRQPHWATNKIVHIRYFVGVFSSEICIMDDNGASFTRLTYNNTTDYLPKLSMDGMKITFTVIAVGPAYQVWTMNSDGTNLRNLTSLFEQGYSPSWSPDGEKIVYTNSKPSNGRLWIMSKDGSSKRQLTY